MRQLWSVSISYLVYNLLLTLLHPFVLIYQAQRYFSGKSRRGWRERSGHLPASLSWAPGSRPRVWIHAVSAGEVVAAVPILRELKARLPDYDLLLSVITPAGREIADQQAASLVAHVFYAPFDLFWVVRRVVKCVNPVAFVSLESELWPNLLHSLKAHGATTVMVNGRISERSFRRVSRFGRPLFRWMLGNMDFLLVQSEADAARFRALVRPADVLRITVLGNSKFDQDIHRLNAAELQGLRYKLLLPEHAPVFVAGSTRSSEEESQVIGAYNRLCKEFPDLRLIIAPRQVERSKGLFHAMVQAGLSPVLKSRIDADTSPDAQLILDTMGELANVYAVATVAFVGNTFDPVVKGGGQNLLQPLAHGKPVLFGPRIATIRSEAELARECGVGFQVANGLELAEKAALLLRSRELLNRIESRALALITSNRGVSARYADMVISVCGLAGLPPVADECKAG